MRLEDIRNNPAIMMHLRWDLHIQKLICQNDEFSKKDAGFYFCIYAWGIYPLDVKAKLVLVHIYPDGSILQNPIEDIPEDMIHEAAERQGGILNGGHNTNKSRESNVRKGRYYLIDKPITKFLKLELDDHQDKKEA